MATKIQLKHKETGVMKTGFYGYSWTTAFFGFLPALFRGDFITFIGGFIVGVIVSMLTFGLGMMVLSPIWGAMYNKYYTTNLLNRGYVLNGSDEENKLAAAALKIELPPARVTAVDIDLTESVAGKAPEASGAN